MIQNPKFKAIMESSSITTNNIDANYAVNSFARIQESAPTIEGPIKYGVESIPSFPVKVGESTMVGVEGTMLDLLCKSQDISETAALEQFKNYLNEQSVGEQLGYGRDVEYSDIAILVQHENIENLYSSVVAEATHTECRIKQINEAVSGRNKVLDLGAKIVVVKN